MPSISTSMESPTWIGPTPAGVPVMIMSPGSRVMYLLRQETIAGTEKRRSEVVPSWRTAPLPPGDDPEPGRVQSGGNYRTHRREGVIAFAGKQAAEFAFAALQHPIAHVVAARVAEHMLQRVRRRDVARPLSDDDGEFALEVNVLPIVGVDDSTRSSR